MEQYIIYKYTKVDTNEVVYIGRTNNLERRRREHEIYEPQEEGRPHYNYPLSKGIRKYGKENYICEVIETVNSYEESLQKEKYWIKYYNTFEDISKYNYTPGGELSFFTAKFDDIIIDEVKSLLEQQISFKEINDRTGVSISHISEINTGKRRKDYTRHYPINEMTCGRKLNDMQIQEIISLLKSSTKTVQEISLLYNVSEATISGINNGKRYKQRDISYPIRNRITTTKNKRLTQNELLLLIDDIINTNIPFARLAIKYNISTRTVYNINKGTTRYNKDYIYPLRK